MLLKHERQGLFLVRALLLILAAVVAAAYLWGVRKGFNLTDEGVYYLGFTHPESVVEYSTSYYLYGARLFSWLGQSIPAMRLAVATANLLVTGIFCWGLVSFLGSSPRRGAGTTASDRSNACAPTDPLSLGLFVFLGTVLKFAYGPCCLSYNHLNSLLLFSSIACVLGAFPNGPENDEKKSRFRTALLFLAGAAAGVDFFIKCSSAALLFVMVVLLPFALKFRRPIERRERLQGVLVTSVGWVAGLLFHFIVLQSPIKWWAVFGPAYFTGARLGYGPGMIVRYSDEISSLLFAMIPWIALPLITGLTGFMALNALSGGKSQKGWQFVARAGTPIAAVALATFAGWFRPWVTGDLTEGGIATFYLYALILFGSAWLVSLLRKGNGRPSLRSRGLVVAGVLFFVPWIGAFGTGNPILSNVNYQLPGWFALLWLLWEAVSRNFNLNQGRQIVPTLIATFSIWQFYTGYVLHPYRIIGPLSEQTEPTEIGVPSSTLWLDPATSRFYSEARQLFKSAGFHPGQSVIGLFDMPGLVFAVGGVAPGNPWLFSNLPEVDARWLQAIPTSRLRNAYIAETGETSGVLKASGLNFPEDYRSVGELAYPGPPPEHIKVWKPLREPDPI